MIKIMKPQDHMTYEMIDIARKASQQVFFYFILVANIEKRAEKYSKESKRITQVKKGSDI
jgi:hypothetical protein